MNNYLSTNINLRYFSVMENKEEIRQLLAVEDTKFEPQYNQPPAETLLNVSNEVTERSKIFDVEIVDGHWQQEFKQSSLYWQVFTCIT